MDLLKLLISTIVQTIVQLNIYYISLLYSHTSIVELFVTIINYTFLSIDPKNDKCRSKNVMVTSRLTNGFFSRVFLLDLAFRSFKRIKCR